MKPVYLIFCLILICEATFGQTRWEVSARGFSTFNILKQGQVNVPQIQHAGLRVGAAFNYWSDLQVSVLYQERTDYTRAELLIETGPPQVAELCSRNRLIRNSKGVELEAMFRFRRPQFSRLHAFLGIGAAYAYSPGLYDTDSLIIPITITRQNGPNRTVDCGFTGSPFGGSQFAAIVAPGLRARLTHRFHFELESQFRYFPFFDRHFIGGAGASLVYNLY